MVILVGILKVFRAMKRGAYDEAALEEHLNNRGLMNRYLGRMTRSVTKPSQMYPIGLLFGLGFDTATEVALLVLAGGAAGAGLPWYAILTLPVLFAAGMSLLDSIDGSFMNFAYGWAFSKPVRKVFYNLTITGLSVAIALVIGTIELGGLLAAKLSLSGTFWSWFENIDLNLLGFLIVALFVLTWLLALAVWRFGRIEERWTMHLADNELSSSRSDPRRPLRSARAAARACRRPRLHAAAGVIATIPTRAAADRDVERRVEAVEHRLRRRRPCRCSRC